MPMLDFGTLTTREKNNVQQFISENSFGLFITDESNKVGISHINLISLDENLNDGLLYGHVSKGNAQAKQLKNAIHVTAVFTLDDINDKSKTAEPEEAGKIVATHIQGELEILSGKAESERFFDKLISKYETMSPNPWKIDWSKKEYSNQMSGIIAFKIKIKKVQMIDLKSLSEANTVNIREQNRSEPNPFLSSLSLENTELKVKTEQSQVTPVNNTLPEHSQNNPQKEDMEFLPLYLPSSFKVTHEDNFRKYMHQYPNCVVINRHQGNLMISYMRFLNDIGNNLTLKPLYAKNLPQTQQHSLYSKAIFRGPHTYISPNWYPDEPFSVPTWNFTTAHMDGLLVSSHQKNNLDNLYELQIKNRVGKFKLNQNRTLPDRLGVIEGLFGKKVASNNDLGIANLMRQTCPMHSHHGSSNAIHQNPGRMTTLYKTFRQNKSKIIAGTLVVATAVAATYCSTHGIKP